MSKLLTELPAFKVLAMPCSDPELEARRVALLTGLIAMFEDCWQFGYDLGRWEAHALPVM